jgi:hypothetical protein
MSWRSRHLSGDKFGRKPPNKSQVGGWVAAKMRLIAEPTERARIGDPYLHQCPDITHDLERRQRRRPASVGAFVYSDFKKIAPNEQLKDQPTYETYIASFAGNASSASTFRQKLMEILGAEESRNFLAEVQIGYTTTFAKGTIVIEPGCFRLPRQWSD